MVCGGCGQKYRGLTRRSNPTPVASAARPVMRPVRWNRGRSVPVVNKPVNSVTLTGQGANPPVTVSPDIVTSPSAPVPAYPMDASTGFPESVIKTGECPENSLGDTRSQPVVMDSESPAPQDKYPTGG